MNAQPNVTLVSQELPYRAQPKKGEKIINK